MTAPLLDTSYTVRYLTGDPPDQAAAAKRVIDGEALLTLTLVVLAETAHVLRSNYRLPRQVIVDALIAFVSKANIQLRALDRAAAIEALLMCRPSGRVSVPDALTWAEARASGANAVYSFDVQFPMDGVDVRRPT